VPVYLNYSLYEAKGYFNRALFRGTVLAAMRLSESLRGTLIDAV
jgi:hypothetical protein